MATVRRQKRREVLIKDLDAHNEKAKALKAEDSLNLIDQRLKMIQNLYVEFQEVRRQLESEEESDIYYDEDRRIDEESLIVRALLADLASVIKIRTEKKVREERAAEKAALINIGRGHQHESDAEEEEISQIKLPPVAIKPFRDLFLALVDQKRSMKTVEKMHYLKSYVTGEAADYIKHIAITAENYKIAWARLENRYHNARVLLDAHLDKLINQPIVPAKSPAALQKNNRHNEREHSHD